MVVVSGGGGTPYMGAPAGVLVDVTPDNSDPMSGDLVAGGLVGVRTARVHDAIVLQQPLKQGVYEIPAGVALAEVLTVDPTLRGAPKRTLWCALTPVVSVGFGLPFPGPRLDCVETDNDGAKIFGVANAGLIATDSQPSPYNIFGVTDASPAPLAAAFDHVPAEQRPKLQIGYRVCKDEADGVTKPWRFVPAAAPILKPGGSETICPFGDWPDLNDKSLLKIDQVTVKVVSGAGATHFEVLKPIPPGPLEPLRPRQPFASSGALLQRIQQHIETLVARPFRPLGPAVATTATVVRHGDMIAQAPVAHGVTGRLKYDVVYGPWFNRHKLSAGQYFFGVPMSNIRDGIQITWCAPEPKADRDTFETICFVKVGDGYISAYAYEPLMPMSLQYSAAAGPSVATFEVERELVPPPAPMQLTWVFDHWIVDPINRAQVAAQLGVEVRVNGKMSPVNHVIVSANFEGRWQLPLMGGVVEFTPVPASGGAKTPLIDSIEHDSASVAIVKPLASDGATPLGGIVQFPQPAFSGVDVLGRPLMKPASPPVQPKMPPLNLNGGGAPAPAPTPPSP